MTTIAQNDIWQQITTTLRSTMTTSTFSNNFGGCKANLTGNELVIFPNGQSQLERIQGHWLKRIKEDAEKLTGRDIKIVFQLPLPAANENVVDVKKAEVETFRVVDKRKRQPFFMVENLIYRDGHAANMRPSGLAVYLCLVMHINADSECWPSYATVAKLTGQSRYGVIKIARRLTDLGYINIIHYSENGRNSSNTFEILEFPNIQIT